MRRLVEGAHHLPNTNNVHPAMMTLPAARRFARSALGAIALLILGLAAPTTAPAVSVSPPLGDACPKSEAETGSILSAGLGPDLESTVVIDYGEGEMLGGTLLNESRIGVSDAFICIYSDAITDEASELVGVAMTGPDGDYQFTLPAGPSRNLAAVYRSDQGQLAAWALSTPVENRTTSAG